MTDSFIQSMIARTQARKDTLGGKVSANKENQLSPILDKTTQPESSVNLQHVNSDSSNSVISNPAECSDDAKNNRMFCNKKRFQLLAERSKCMNDWEDDYTYHSNSKEHKEAQGFTPTRSQSRLVYSFSKDSIVSSDSNIQSEMTSSTDPVQSNIDEKTAKNDSWQTSKSSTSVNNLKNKWEQAIRNASPDRQCSPKKYNFGSPDRKVGYGSPEKKVNYASSENLDDYERISRSPQKIPHKSPLHKRPISPYKPNPVGKIIKGEVPMADTVPVVLKEKASVKDKIAAFSGIAQPKSIERKDPAELSVKDRFNIFEKANNKALVPKAAFAQCIPTESKSPHNTELTESDKYQATNRVGKQKFENTWKNNDIHEHVIIDRQRDMNILKNRFKKPYPVDHQMESDSEYPESEYSREGSPELPPEKPPRVVLSPLKYDSGSSCSSSVNSPIKRLNSTDLYANTSSLNRYEPRIKPGCLFPCLSDIESTSEAMESQDEDIKESSMATTASGDSLGTCIQRMAHGEDTEASEGLSTIVELTETRKMTTMSDETMDALEAIDDALDEALHDDKSSPKRIKIENEAFKTPKLSSSSDSKSPSTPLAHSISMYRNQKSADVTITPLRHTMLKNEIMSPKKSPVSPSVNITSCIRALQNEEESQLTIISQASNALSMVNQHPKLHGKDEHIAAEKLLLVSTQKRKSAINEIQRLKAEGALGRSTWAFDEESSKGSISMSNITLPLKQEFINKQMNDKSHHFVVLVKHRDQVITSELVKTPDNVIESAVTFPNLMALHNLSAEFNITVEVYCLKIDSEPNHSTKKEQSRLKLTPLRRLQKESRAASPVIQSPGGPYAVRSPSFELVGFTTLNINTLTRNAWTLEKVPYNSPLDGHLLMRVSCMMEGGVSEKCFLTMFEDVGGFGAWNRRWCVLDGPFIKYWSYPDDETKKECLNFIDLRSCTTRKVEIVTWDICARPHTFQLTLVRPVRQGDQTNLVQELKRNALVSKILISADSKEERIIWCNKLNKALANIRAWDPDSLRPEDFVV